MINKNGINAIKSILGEDFIDELAKSDVGAVINLKTQTGAIPEEMKIALQIVPRTVLSYLFANLKHRNIDEPFELILPFAENTIMFANKKGPDNYTGEIVQDGERITHFKNRPLPSIGLILLSTFELYDMDMLDEIKEAPNIQEPEYARIDQLQDMIDARLSMQHLIQDVVDRRISEREAINQIIKDRLNSHIMSVANPPEEDNVEQPKKSRLREFLENREKKLKEPVEIDKNEISCPDCGIALHKGEEKTIKLCVCYGNYANTEIKIKKKQDGKVTLKFPQSFEVDNIEMLLDALKGKGV